MDDESFVSPLEGVAFHDTALTSVQLALDRMMCAVEIEGSSGQIPRGERVTIAFHDLHSFYASFNFAEMLHNARPGNVQDGHYYASGLFRAYVTGGMLEAGATHLTLGDSTPLDDSDSGESMPVLLSDYRSLYDVDFDFGFLQRVGISPALGTVTAHVLMRVGDLSSDLVPAVLSFSGVKSCNLRLDVAAMRDSVRFGNIASLRVNVKGGIVWIYCREGFVEVVAEQVMLKKFG